jgi:hypothetical protein
VGRDRNSDRGRPVEPAEARAYSSDRDAVRVDHEGEREARTQIDGRYAEQRGAGDVRAYERIPDIARRGRGLDLVARRDSVRWGPVWAGLITTLTAFLLLELLALGVGLLSISLNPNSPNQASAWVSAAIGLIAFFTGGSVAGMTAAVRGTATGLLNGFLVWALGTVLILVLSALGLGQVFGALGNVVGQLGMLQDMLQGGVRVPNVDPQQVLSAVRTGALIGFFSLLLSAAAATLGGWLGGRTDRPIGHMVDESEHS